MTPNSKCRQMSKDDPALKDASSFRKLKRLAPHEAFFFQGNMFPLKSGPVNFFYCNNFTMFHFWSPFDIFFPTKNPWKNLPKTPGMLGVNFRPLRAKWSPRCKIPHGPLMFFRNHSSVMWKFRRWVGGNKNRMQRTKGVPPRKLTWNLKMMVSNRNLLFQGFIFRFHVCFLGIELKVTGRVCRFNSTIVFGNWCLPCYLSAWNL